MADYNVLKAAIADYVKDRTGLSTIDGDGLQETLLAIVNSIGVGYVFMGVADLTTNPGNPDQRVWYLAATAGIYSNFNNITLAQYEIAVLKWDTEWHKEVIQDIPSKSQIDERLDEQDTEIDRRMDVQDGRLDGQDARLDGQDEEIADFKEAVQNQVDNYPMITIDGNVTNAPDEEDITSVEENGNDVLKFKNRSAVDGMGYVILRKGGSNTFANQVTAANTIYEIRYDFDLGGDSVTIPTGCVLKFNGGKLSNGTLNLNGGFVDAPGELVFDSVILQNAGNDVLNGRWLFVDNQSVTTAQFAALPERRIDFAGLILLSSEALSCQYADWENLTIEAPQIIVSAGEPIGQIKCNKPAALITSHDLITAISVSENSIGDLTGKIICIKLGKHVAYDWREDGTTHLPTLFKGITSYVNMYDPDNNIATLDDYIEPFDASYTYEDSLGNSHSIETIAYIISATSVRFKNCKFISNDNSQNFVTISGVHNGLIENCAFTSKNEAGCPCLLGIGHSIGVIVSNCVVSNAVYPGTGTSYGIQVGASTRVQVLKSKFYGNRRGVDFSGTFESRYGEVSHCQVYGSNEIIDGEGQSIGSCIGGHSTSYMNAFRDNTLVGQSSRTGIQLRGECEIVEGNLIFGSFNSAAITAGYKTIIKGNLFDSGIPGSTFVWAEEVSDDNHIVVSNNMARNIWNFVRCGGTSGKYTIVGNDVSFGVNNANIFPKAEVFASGNKFSGVNDTTRLVAKNITPDTLILANNQIQMPIELLAKAYGVYGGTSSRLENITAKGKLDIDTISSGKIILTADIEVTGENSINYIGFSPTVCPIDYGDYVVNSENIARKILSSKFTYSGQDIEEPGIRVCVKDGVIYVSRDIFVRFPQGRKYHIVAELSAIRQDVNRCVCVSVRVTSASNRRYFIPLGLWVPDPAYVVDGVAIVTEERILTISLSETTAKYASANNIVSGVTYSTDRAAAIAFSDGAGATAAMVNADPSPQTYAPYLGLAYASANIPAGNWYVPTIKDWLLISKHIHEINIALRTLGGTEIGTIPQNTSVEESAGKNWVFSPTYNVIYTANKSSSLATRFVTEYVKD